MICIDTAFENCLFFAYESGLKNIKKCTSRYSNESTLQSVGYLTIHSCHRISILVRAESDGYIEGDGGWYMKTDGRGKGVGKGDRDCGHVLFLLLCCLHL